MRSDKELWGLVLEDFEKRGLGWGICIIISDLWRSKVISCDERSRLFSKMAEMKNLPWYVKLYYRFRFKVTYRSTMRYWWSLEHFSATECYELRIKWLKYMVRRS